MCSEVKCAHEHIGTMYKHGHSQVQTVIIHVIFSESQIGRFGISQREIGVSDREIFACRIISYFGPKLTLLKTNFLGVFWVPQSYYATIQWNCHCIKRNNLWPSHIGNGIKEH